MPGPRVVLDTNVLVAASRSKRGASALLLSLVGTGKFETCISVPLLLEYESALLRDVDPGSPDWHVSVDVLDYLSAVGFRQPIFFLWRPFLGDPGDEMVLEAAVAGECSAIVTYNKRDFKGVDLFNLQIYSPKEFLEIIGALP